MTDSSLTFLILLALALGIDDLAAAFAFGAKGAKIPILTRLLICLASVIVFGGALTFGNTLSSVMPYHLAEIAGIILMTCILFLIALDIFKPKPKKAPQSHRKKPPTSTNKALTTFHNPLLSGRTKKISISGALLLGAALSIDSVGVGIGFAMTAPIHPIGILLAGIAQFALFSLGLTLGHQLHRSSFKHGEKLHIISCLVILCVIIWRILSII